jgi:hypothetical protein
VPKSPETRRDGFADIRVIFDDEYPHEHPRTSAGEIPSQAVVSFGVYTARKASPKADGAQ